MTQISAIQSYTKGMTYDQLLGDRKTREAIKKIPPEIMDRHPDVPWKEFAGMREKLVHGYFQISPTILWETCRHDLTPLAAVVKVLLLEYT